MEKLILTDCDGVILDWLDGFMPWMSKRGYDPVIEGKVEEMYALDKKFGTPADEMHELVHEYNSSDAMRSLAPYKDAAEVLPQLSERGFRFVAITSLGRQSTVNRSKNLMDLFGNVFDEVICLPQRRCKRNVLKRWENTGLLWIEDDPENAMDGQNLGLHGVIVDTAYNRKADIACTRVNENTPWADIAKIITEIY